MKLDDSDSRSMAPWEKGKLCMLHEEGKSIEEIAKECDRSIYWTTLVVNAFTGESRKELITEYEAYLEKQKRKETKNEKNYTK